MSWLLQSLFFLSQEPGIFKNGDMLGDEGNDFIVDSHCIFLGVTKICVWMPLAILSAF